MNGKEQKTYLLVGLGRFGTALCEKLASLGQNVIGVDSSAAPVAEIADKISVAAQMDVTDEASLVKIGAKEADVAIVTIGEAVEPSVLCTSLLVELGVPLVIARACNKLHARVLERVGAHRVIFPEWDMGARIGEALVYPWYSSFTRIDGGNFVIGKISPLPEMIGHTMRKAVQPQPDASHRGRGQAVDTGHDRRHPGPRRRGIAPRCAPPEDEIYPAHVKAPRQEA